MISSTHLPVPLQAGFVQPAWIDYNGHMNDAYYLLQFSAASDVWLDAIGLDGVYRQRSGRAMYTAEVHLVYLQELLLAAPFHIAAMLLGFDTKRMHLFMEMRHTEHDYLAATCEWMLIHVDRTSGKSAAMPAAVQDRLLALQADHSLVERPVQAGRAISLASRRPL